MTHTATGARSRLALVTGAGLVAAVGLLVGCSGGDTEPRPTASAPAPATSPSPSGSADGAPDPTSEPAPSPTRVTRVRDSGDIVTGLSAPWSVAFLPDGTALVSERDDARIVAVDEQRNRFTEVGRVDGVDNTGEGGLMGLAVQPDSDPVRVFAMWSTASDNRVGVMTWNGRRLSPPRVIVSGIPHNVIHNGGRLAFGPDGLLYVATGDAAEPGLAQDGASPAGKILRFTAEGEIPADNPDPTSPVYSSGHRNVQGLAFDGGGRLWASEFGASDVDELNRIVADGNYGWPVVEGAGGGPGFRDPVVQWSPTAVASPSGLAIAGGSAWVASLRGEVLYQVPLQGRRAEDPIARFDGEFGRLRDVVVAPDGSLWLVTNNTDGRGSPRQGDDRIIRLEIS